MNALDEVYIFRIGDIVTGIANGSFQINGVGRTGQVTDDEADYAGRIELELKSKKTDSMENPRVRVRPEDVIRQPIEVLSWECDACNGDLCNEVHTASEISSSIKNCHLHFGPLAVSAAATFMLQFIQLREIVGGFLR
jgi:hypothetical protein